MACCTGVTECEQLITIGFLNSFIGNDVQDSTGAPKTAAGRSDYCPTYSELTGGSLIQNWKEGATPNKDQDGIIISGSYAGGECVKKSSLSMKYTRFKEFSISAASITLSACGESTTISYTHKYDRCTKNVNGSCESAASPVCTTVSDTEKSEITWTNSNNVFTFNTNTGVVSVSKNNPNNNGRSNARSTTIKGEITFRGAEHNSSVTITQNGLTGKYMYWYSDYYVHGNGVSCSTPQSFGCAGGSYGATAYYYRDDWDVYRWRDQCDTDYDSDTEIRNKVVNQYREYDTYSGSFSDKSGLCGTWNASKSWPGYGSCSWSQTCNECGCEPPCEDCNKKVYGYGTYSGSVPCSGGNVTMTATIPGTSYTYVYDEETSGCTVSTAATSATQVRIENFSCNTSSSSKTHTGYSGNIYYTITQEGGPCCSSSSTTTYTDVYLSCSAHTNENVRTVYSTYYRSTCCVGSTSRGYTDYYKVNIGCNSGDTRELTDSQKSNAPFKIYQYGGSTCCGCGDETTTYTYAVANVNCSAHTDEQVSVSYTSTTTYSVAVCTPTTGSGTTNVTVNIPCNDTSSTKDYTVDGPFGGTVTIRQASGPCCPVVCTCADLTATPTSCTWSYNDRTSRTVTISSASCITDISLNSLNFFTATLGSNKVTITPIGDNNDNYEHTDILRISYKANGTNCGININLVQRVRTCTCTDLTLSPTSFTWNYDEITSKLITVTSASCIDSIGVSSPTHFNATISNGQIAVSPKGANITQSPYVDTLIVSYAATNRACSSAITLTQNINPTCPTAITYDFETVHINCDNQNKVYIPYTSHTTNEDCTVTDYSDTAEVRYDFPANCRGASYTVTVFGQSVTVIQDPCSCECTPGTDNFSTASVHIGATVGSQSSDSWRCGMQPGYIQSHYISNGATWLSYYIDNTGLYFTATQDNPSCKSRIAEIEFITRDDSLNNSNCGVPFCKNWYMQIEQSGGADPCPCSEFDVTQTVFSIPSGSCSSLVIGTYDTNTCITGLRIQERAGKTWVSPSIGGGQITITCQANTTGESRRMSLIITGFTGCNNPCQYVKEIIQEG